MYKLKGHSQLTHTRIKYHFLADLHVTRRAWNKSVSGILWTNLVELNLLQAKIVIIGPKPHQSSLLDFPGLLKSLVSKWRIVRVKTWTKALFFEEILIQFPWENLHKLTCSNERMQYFCNAPKLNLKSRHSASVYATVRRKGCSNQRWSWLYYNTINFRQQRILYPHL